MSKISLRKLYLDLNIFPDILPIVIESHQHIPALAWVIPAKAQNYYLGMLIFSLLMLLSTLLVRLKMESLSGLTDLVVSTTKVRGGLSTFCPCLSCTPDWGHSSHWQLPRHLWSGGQEESGLEEEGSHSQFGESGGWQTQSWNESMWTEIVTFGKS